MPSEISTEVILDTSVLINFLVIRRLDLLRAHPRYRFAVTNHVRAEITEHYPEQKAQLESALNTGWLQEITVIDTRELDVFVELSRSGRLGAGECSAMSVAVCRTLPLAIDDKTARKRAAAFNPKIELLDTEALVLSLIRESSIGVEEADEIKHEWEREHRFKLSFASFAERI